MYNRSAFFMPPSSHAELTDRYENLALGGGREMHGLPAADIRIERT
jgi:hypothetical protein